MEPRERLKPAWKGLLLFFSLGATALFVANCQVVAPRQGWSRAWGPLISHKKFPGDCGLCHIPERWDRLRSDFSFDHLKETGHALEGAHGRAACLRCHNDRGPVAVYTARGCGGCHPDPHRSGMGLDCARCHEQTTWRPAGLIAEHARTRFPLFGIHAATPCERCHPRSPVGEFRGSPVDCDLCHRQDLARTASPDHAASGWTRNCGRCHTPTDWSRANLSHSFFPLTGGHSGLDCTRCHTSGTLGPISSDCYSCHRTDYEGAPHHLAGNFPRDCRGCHSTVSWSAVHFNHGSFPLSGGHTGLACVRCHTSGSFGSIPSACISCHQADCASAPNHVALTFPQDCQRCHSTQSWTGTGFNHPFPLAGAHNVACTTCHDAGSSSAFNCLGCHTKAATDAKHQGQSGYSYSSPACYQCHRNG